MISMRKDANIDNFLYKATCTQNTISKQLRYAIGANFLNELKRTYPITPLKMP